MISSTPDRVIVLCIISEYSLNWIQFQSTVESLASDFPQVDFYKIDIDKSQVPSFVNGGESCILPSFYFFMDGQEIDCVCGAT